jgi:hypothetical protein
MRLRTMKPLRISGLPGARRWGYRTAGLVMALLTGGSLATALAASPAIAQTPGPAPGVNMGAAATGASSVYMAYAATNGAAYLRNEITGNVTALGGRLTGGPAVAQTAAGLSVFGRGTNNALWWTHQMTGGKWSSWQSLGGVITSQPGVTGLTAGSGSVLALARGADGALWFRAQGSGGWSAWKSFGGKLLPGTGPAAVNADGGFVVAVTGTDHHVWLFGPMGMQRYGFLNFGGLTNSTPGITALPGVMSPQLTVFARGTDNVMWCKQSILPIGGTGDWTWLGGVLTTGPAAATVPGGKMYVFVLGSDNLPYMWSGTSPSSGVWTGA